MTLVNDTNLSYAHTLKIRRLVFSSGNGNSIFLSILPGRIKAGSKVSIRLVAIITLNSREHYANLQFNENQSVNQLQYFHISS